MLNHICLTFDEKYLTPAMVLIRSILKNNSKDTINFWLITHKISAPGIEILHKSIPCDVNYKIIEKINVDERLGRSNASALDYISPAAIIRIYIDEILPKTFDRILYLDSDIMCIGDISGIFKINLAGYAIGAVRDLTLERFVDGRPFPGIDQYPNINLHSEYFNSGVLLIDRKKWREAHVRENAEKYLHCNLGNLRCNDQDALNIALYKKWRRIEKKWNYMRPLRLEPKWGGCLQEASLVHFFSPIKVWHPEYPAYHLKEKFFEYKTAIEYQKN